MKMPIISIYVAPSDIESARRIAKKMFPDRPDLLDARHAIAAAVEIGMGSLRVVWHDAEDQASAYADSKIRSDKLERNESSTEHDMTTDGVPMKAGE